MRIGLRKNDAGGRASAGIASMALPAPVRVVPASMAGEAVDGGLLNRLGPCRGRDRRSACLRSGRNAGDQFAAGPDLFCLTDNQSDLCEQIQILRTVFEVLFA